MELEALHKFMEEHQLSSNKVGVKAKIATSNVSRVLKGVTRLTPELVLRIYAVYPELLEYVTDPKERKAILTGTLPEKFVKAVDGSNKNLPYLPQKLRAEFNQRSPQNVSALSRFSGIPEVIDTIGKNTEIIIEVIETGLGGRIVVGDLVKASLVVENNWVFVQGYIFIVFATYAIIRKVSKNTLADKGGFIELGTENGASIFVKKEDIMQLFQVDTIVSGRVSF